MGSPQISPHQHGTHTCSHANTKRPTSPIDGLVQHCSNSSALAMELLQSRTEPLQFDGLVLDCSNSSALAMQLLQFCIKPSSRTVQHIKYAHNYVSLWLYFIFRGCM